jgi:XTP/dITP diphosphohydrolase
MRILLATRSRHKADEIRRILAGVEALELITLDEAGVPEAPEEETIEAFETFEENALAKARYFHERTGLATLADDSGIAVDALGGAPGVRSKRFAPARGLSGQARDDENNRYLLERLEGISPEDRTARYVCVAVLVEPGGTARVFRGEAPGIIVPGSRGDGGFGYDPFFYDLELGRTFAEITPEEKNARSHRGKAFRALALALEQPGAGAVSSSSPQGSGS